MNARILLILSGGLGFLSVALGAFAAHGLREVLSPEDLKVFQTGVQYQMAHSLALLAISLFWIKNQDLDFTWVAYFFLLGVLLFSGSLYALTLSGIKILGAITPLGGLAFLAGWATLIRLAWKI